MTIEPFDLSIIHELESEFRTEGYFLTLATPSDYGVVERLSAQAAREEVTTPLTASTIEWLVDRNPAGKGFLVLAKSAHDQKIVGHFLFYPKEMIARADGTRAAVRLSVFLCVNLYVDAAYRRRGIFEKMTMFGRTLLGHSGISFLYTVPNQRSTPGFLKLGMPKIRTLPFFARPTKAPFSWINAISRLSETSTTIRAVTEFDISTVCTLALHAPSDHAQVWGARNAVSLNWRYRDRPHVKYAIRIVEVEGCPVGYVVIRRMPIMKYSALVICDYWLGDAPAGALGEVMNTALSEESGKIDIVIAMAGSRNKKHRHEFCRAGFLPIPQFMLPQPITLIGGKTGASFDGPKIGDMSEWALTPFDWDVF